MSRTLAIVPARAGSKRIPDKNLRDFLGKPLIVWSIEFAKAYPMFDRIVVSTDSAAIAKIARAAGAEVPWLRPAELASDAASTIDVVVHALQNAGESFDRVAVLQPTSPIRLATRWNSAYEALNKGAPAVVGVSMATTHPFWSYSLSDDNALTAFFPDKTAVRSQDLPPACCPNGSLYLASSVEVILQRSLKPIGVHGVVCDQKVEQVDIDTPEDWLKAECVVREYLQSAT